MTHKTVYLPQNQSILMKLPYGKSDYRTLIENNYFYQDRTSYLETLEDWGATYLLYLRPRRFGKSLWISTLQYYYDVRFKNDFNTLFGKTYIGQNPTPNANNYMVLRFDFSAINTTTEEGVQKGFFSNISKGVESFLSYHKTAFTDNQRQKILAETDPSEMIKSLFNYAYTNNLAHKIYLLIDEYDHFANELISFNFHHFINIVTKNGYVRKFYETIKIATGQGIVERIFMTGVSPITVDSLTSGFNIASNISLTPTFHQMVGFDEQEVNGILEKIGVKSDNQTEVLNSMRLWYNGYLFSVRAKNKVYNPNMVLFFASGYQEMQDFPSDMLDPNIATDYGKIQKLFNIQGKSTEYLDVLSELLETGTVQATLTQQYSFERGFTKHDLISLLFYMGFLTIRSESLRTYTFAFPNYVIKRLYADFFFFSTLEKAQLPIDNAPVNEAIRDMATSGNPKAFFEQVKLILHYFSTRDSGHFNENTLKAIIMSLLHQQNFYYLHSEYETDWTYMDVFLEAIQGQKPNFEVAMELKYLPKGGKVAINSTFEAASTQLKDYLDTPKFNTRPNIKSFVVVVAGKKLEWRELK
jgi:Predicted AAA-ATPase/PD-(D/E)XK nuclease superfamily